VNATRRAQQSSVAANPKLRMVRNQYGYVIYSARRWADCRSG
jgi:hypothetical protein